MYSNVQYASTQKEWFSRQGAKLVKVFQYVIGVG